jgi:feruloyl esterase
MMIRFLFFLLAASIAAADDPKCQAVAKLALKNATFKVEELSGSFTPPGAPRPLTDLPAFCRVFGSLKPSADSDIQFEVWLPATSSWNGKFQGIGNGGFAGSISYPQLADALRHNYATASTDTGHQASGIDGAWANGHLEKLVDYGYRAVHETAVAAKAVIHGYYGSAPKKSYFSSCSNGGRQALMEAQRYPDDYDGLIAGAPAADFVPLAGDFVSNLQALRNDPAITIPPAKLAAIEAAALAACDAADGVKDGVIDNPARCNFDPGVLLCSGEESNACLTAPQITALKAIYAGLKNGKGESIYPGYSVGGETGFGGWSAWIIGPNTAQYAFGTQFFKHFVYGDPQWNFKTFTFEKDYKVADDKVGRILNATDPDLKKFAARGGKLILYHGWSDAAIPPVATINYYNRVMTTMGEKQADAFTRLYMVPGMQHCGGGPGPDNFGQGTVAHTDPDHDVDAALERWVEKGVAPGPIVASKNKGAEVVRTRPLCPFPQEAKYKGMGNTDDAANFTCAALK